MTGEKNMQDQHQGPSQAGTKTVHQAARQQQCGGEVAQATAEGQQPHQRWRHQLHFL